MIIGIDLGTTNSLVGYWDGNGPRLIPNALGSVLTPSCVGIDEDRSILVGAPALERLRSHPDATAALFKRHMGTNKVFRMRGKEFRAEELSALLLRSLKADAESHLGEAVDEAIITVPAYFSDAQRKATKAAARLAGLECDRLLNEPTAAALAYGIHHRTGESRFLVFDLGGGTFDVSILDLFEGVMEVRASCGDNMLGGEDFVTILVEWFFQQHSDLKNYRFDPRFMQRLVAAAETTKRTLGTQNSALLRVTHQGEELSSEIDIQTFQTLSQPLLLRLKAPVERALRDANMRDSDLDEIVLAGGATRMPMVRDLVERLFGRSPASNIHPDEVVALGSAVQAGLKMRHAALNEIVMTDVCPYSLGVQISKQFEDGRYTSGFFDPIVERNSIVPISQVKVYSPIDPRSREIEVQIFQGEARLVKDNHLLGTIKVPLPSGNQVQRDVQVRFTYDLNGILEVEALPLGSGQVHRLVIEGNPGVLSPEEIEERLARLADLKLHPRERMENRTLLARAERLYQELLGDQRQWLSDQIFRFEHILDSGDRSLIQKAQVQFSELLDKVEFVDLIHISGVQ